MVQPVAIVVVESTGVGCVTRTTRRAGDVKALYPMIESR
jgi:hypothetical protein